MMAAKTIYDQKSYKKVINKLENFDRSFTFVIILMILSGSVKKTNLIY